MLKVKDIDFVAENIYFIGMHHEWSIQPCWRSVVQKTTNATHTFEKLKVNLHKVAAMTLPLNTYPGPTLKLH